MTAQTAELPQQLRLDFKDSSLPFNINCLYSHYGDYSLDSTDLMSLDSLTPQWSQNVIKQMQLGPLNLPEWLLTQLRTRIVLK